MKALFLPWWRDRTARERWLVGVMAVLLVVVIGWLGVQRPLASARSAAMTREADATTGLAEVKSMGGAIRAAEQRAGTAPAIPLVELVSQRANEAGLTAERLDTSGDGRVTMRVAAVRPPALLRWIAALESGDGIIVDRAAIARNGDATVSVELALRSRRA